MYTFNSKTDVGVDFSITSLFSPDDDIQTAILNTVKSGTTSIKMMIYGFHLPILTDLLIAKHQAGVDVQIVLDYSQSKGVAEAAEVKKLVTAGVDTVIGTSPEAHQICHEKGICVDNQLVLTGSYNFSLSAAKQVNHCDFIASKERADWFSSFFKEIRGWMLSNEPQDQLEAHL